MRHAFRFIAPSLLAALLFTGCGSPVATTSLRTTASTSLEALDVPPASAFVTIQAKVQQVLPADDDGLTHQNFVVVTIKPKAGQTLEVNNSTSHGSEVTGLAAGQILEIRGVMYHDSRRNRDGIHWTHHADRPGDAGYIKTASGKVFE